MVSEVMMDSVRDGEDISGALTLKDIQKRSQADIVLVVKKEKQIGMQVPEDADVDVGEKRKLESEGGSVTIALLTSCR